MSKGNSVIRIGIIGVGFMGYTHFEGARDLTGAKVTAIATRDQKKLAGDWTSIQGNFGPPGGHVDVSELKCYSDYRQLLADPEIDLVDVCLLGRSGQRGIGVDELREAKDRVER